MLPIIKTKSVGLTPLQAGVLLYPSAYLLKAEGFFL